MAGSTSMAVDGARAAMAGFIAPTRMAAWKPATAGMLAATTSSASRSSMARMLGLGFPGEGGALIVGHGKTLPGRRGSSEKEPAGFGSSGRACRRMENSHHARSVASPAGMTAALELTVLLAGAGPSIEGLLSRCTEPSLDVDGRVVKLKLVHVHSTGEEGSLRANSALPLPVDVVVVVESVRMLLASTHKPSAADELRYSVGGLTAEHFIGDEASVTEESQP